VMVAAAPKVDLVVACTVSRGRVREGGVIAWRQRSKLGTLVATKQRERIIGSSRSPAECSSASRSLVAVAIRILVFPRYLVVAMAAT
jgi:hypothetical protein